MTDVLILFKINSKLYYITEKISKYCLVLKYLNSNSNNNDDNNTNSNDNNCSENNTDSEFNNTGVIQLDSSGISDFDNIVIDERKIIGTGLMKNSGLKVFVKLSKTMSEKIDTMNLVTTISHPNICRIYKYVHTSNRISDVSGWNCSNITITAMEPLDCFDHTYAYNSNNFECFLQNVFIGCLKGLECLHSNNVVHCDISVNNIMFRNYNEPVIIDMNNSSIMNSEYAKTCLHFKPDYTPTDINYRFTPTHDLYALAVVLIKLMMRHSRLVCDKMSSHIVQVDILQSHFAFTEIEGLCSVLKDMINCKYHSATKCLEDVNNELKKSNDN
ncbi:predicted protein [Naegleria gruberi]|uniref:Predicted protein n=1 Tax=Naegleria gruberi TaxID=5762 RepID=D2VMZ6_NAEGR|nr:uncharacterized protein NAEGRDRAFT_70318 [Naegleria gruberi]EFC41907.1 predicted protein [Naegleria gruberi]|eukprot:XP_002674651.1 predicted protein [Naegleria gruberi strain NEG-M]